MWFSVARAGLMVCLVAIGAAAQATYSVDMVTKFVRNAVHEKMQDREIAQFLATIKMRQKLDPTTVEALQGDGAGPRTVAALNKLAEMSASLAAPPAPSNAPPPPTYDQLHPPPPYEEQYKIINETREMALNYSKSLPNFICLQMTFRYYDRHYQAGSEGSWAQADTLKARVSYNDQKEDYQLLGVNDDSVVNKGYESVGGAISRGEFGSLLKEVFDQETQTEFHWLRWGALSGVLCHVYKYKVEQEHSKWTVDYQRLQQVTPAYEGLVYVDTRTHQVLRVTLDALMPPTFPIQEVHTRLDYKNIDIGGQQFLLPTRSEVRMRHDHVGTRNVIEFRGYRRYSADTSISFADAEADPTPEGQEEKPQDKTKPGSASKKQPKP